MRPVVSEPAALAGGGVWGWGRDGLGTGAQGRGREGAAGVDADYARHQQATEQVLRELA